MKNIPNKIYLQVGEYCPDDADYNELSEVTFSKESVWSNDIEYVLAKLSKEEIALIERVLYRGESLADGYTGDFITRFNESARELEAWLKIQRGK